MPATEVKEYHPLPTIRRYHESPAQIKAIVGPVGSGKTSGAAMQHGYYLPMFLAKQHHIRHTRHVIVRNTYPELVDTTLQTVKDWFPDGEVHDKPPNMTLRYPDDIMCEFWFRSCDRPDHIKHFKSLEVTTYWIDESIEVSEEIKRMLKNRIGRFPRLCPVRFGTETTNPPDVEHPTYSQFAWDTPPPGPVPEGQPLPNHIGFWQPPGENKANLRPGYYDALRNDYLHTPDWIEIYVDGKPGIIPTGRLVYNNFDRKYHVASDQLIWAKGKLYRGWDNSGNCPAAVVVQMPRAGHVQVLAEYVTDKMNIIDFANWVRIDCNTRWPTAEFEDWADPAGNNQYSKKEGGFTSNAQLMAEESKVEVIASEHNLTARIEAVEQQLKIRDGLLIDSSCTRLINGFIGGYAYPEIGNSGHFRKDPEKNRFSHVHDALQYIMCGLVGTRESSMSAADARRLEQMYGPPAQLY